MLNKALICLISSMLMSYSLHADEITINPDHPDEYTVVKGDTLWDISARFLQEPWRWPEIWEINQQIEDPHLIYPGDIVALVYRDGQPVLQVKRSGSEDDQRIVSRVGRDVKLSPEIRSYERDDAIAFIPAETIEQFLNQSIVLGDDSSSLWPYVIASYEDHLIATTGNKIYIRGIPEDSSVRKYSIYRTGNTYRRGMSDEILGYEAIYVGDAVITKLGDPSSAVVLSSQREVLEGDRLYPQGAFHSQRESDSQSFGYIPRRFDKDVEGHIISVVDGVSQIGQYQVVVLDVGRHQGIVPGHVFGIYQHGQVAQDRFKKKIENQKRYASYKFDPNLSLLERDVADGIYRMREKIKRWKEKTFHTKDELSYETEDVNLPEEYAGVVMVLRTFDKVSYALVIEAEATVHVLDKVRGL